MRNVVTAFIAVRSLMNNKRTAAKSALKNVADTIVCGFATSAVSAVAAVSARI